MRRRLVELYRHVKHRQLGRSYFSVRPTDGFIVSWPRSGNTWLRHMIFYATRPQQTWDLPKLDETMPMVSRPDIARVLPRLDAEPRRLFKSHEPFAPWALTGRTVYLVRDVRDALVSYYHYRRQMGHTQIEVGPFVGRCLRGKDAYGSWHDHVRGWWQHRDHEHVCILHYEQMLIDPAHSLRQALTCLGLSASDDMVERAVERSNLGQINKSFGKYAEARGKAFGGGLGGKRGMGKQMLSPDDLVKIERVAGPVMRELGYLK